MWEIVTFVKGFVNMWILEYQMETKTFLKTHLPTYVLTVVTVVSLVTVETVVSVVAVTKQSVTFFKGFVKKWLLEYQMVTKTVIKSTYIGKPSREKKLLT